jgi:hypothetical protein
MLFVELLNLFMNIFGIYILWIIIHYNASHLYVYFCVPDGFYGFLISPLLVQTPHCRVLRFMIFNGANNINIFWGFVISFIIKSLTIKNK